MWGSKHVCAHNVVMGWTKAFWVSPWLPTLSVASARGVRVATVHTAETSELGKDLSKIIDIPTASLKRTSMRDMHSSLAVVQALSVMLDPEAPVRFLFAGLGDFF